MLPFVRLLAITAGLAATSGHVFACRCSVAWKGTAWERAEQEARDSSAIFEGVPIRVEARWQVLAAKPNALIPAGFDWQESNNLAEPYMLITFRVKRAYKGKMGATIQLRTGVGGGDCGISYQTGLEYLVYASGPNASQLGVNICSPGGWLGGGYVQTELRRLRGERPLASDLAPLDEGSPSAVERSRKEGREYARSFAAVTGQICGRIVSAPAADGEVMRVAFLPTAGYSPRGYDVADVDSRGRFCSGRLGPGGYRVELRQLLRGGVKAAAYHSGAVEREKSRAVAVRAGRVSKVSFRAPRSNARTIQGTVSVDDASAIGGKIAVRLIGRDGRIWGYEEIAAADSRRPSGARRFAFRGVPPGWYRTWVEAPKPGWLTRISEVHVAGSDRRVSLELRRAPAGRR